MQQVRPCEGQQMLVFISNKSHGCSMRRIAHLFAGGSLTIQLAACGTPATVGDSQLLSFLKDGSTTHEDVYLNLAEPSATFESGRIQTYLLDEDKDGYILMHHGGQGWNGKYSLVLGFDEHGVLRRHSLVRIRVNPKSP